MPLSGLNKFKNDSGAIASLLSAVRHDCSSTLLLLGDSTGNDTTDWFYRLLNEKLKPALPDVCIRYCLWNDTTQRYDAFTTLSQGSSGQRYARFNSLSYRVFSVTEISSSSPDLEVEIKISMDDWTPAASARLVGRIGSSGNRGWYLQLNTNGTLTFFWSADGTNLLSGTSSAPSFTDGVAYNIRVKMDVDNGGGGYTLTIEKSADDGLNWTNILNSVTSAGTTSIFASTAAYSIGAASGSGYYTGNVYDVVVRDGISGPYLVHASIESWGSADASNSANNSFGGSPTLYVFNGSKAGSGISYIDDATRRPKLCVPSVVQCTMLSTGHNDIAYRVGNSLLTAWSTMITNLKARLPNSGFVVLTQNPRNTAVAAGKSFADEQRQIEHALPLMLQRFGVEYIDTYHAFEPFKSDYSSIISDGVHPSGEGIDIWMNEVWKQMDSFLFD